MSGPAVSTLTLAQICDGIDVIVAEVSGVLRSESYDELSNAPQDDYVVQVYPVSWASQPITFRGGMNDASPVIRVDLIGRQRRELGADMGGLIAVADEMNTALIVQQMADPPFAVSGLKKGWTWTAEYVVFDFGMVGTQPVQRVGVRYVLTLRTF